MPGVFSVKEAMAQTKVDYLIGGAACVGSGVLANLAVGWINKGLKALQGLVPKMFKFLNLEVPTGDDRLRWQKEFGDTIGRCMARGMMNQMTARMIGAVRTSGRTGEPAFVRDWRRFKLNAQYRGENLFRAMLGSTELCPYFSGDIKTLFKANNQPNVNTRTMTRVGNLDPFNRRAKCTMPRGWSLQNYQTDFAGNGGWGALNRLAQPQNNYYGNLMMSMAELGVQRLTEEENDLDEAKTALGFTSRRQQNPAITTSNGGGYCLNNQSKSCTTNAQCAVAGTGGNLPTTGTCIPKRNTCLLNASNNRCIVYSNILTPGSVLQQTATNVIQQELNWLTNVQSLQGFISDLTSLVLSRVLNLSAPDDEQQEPYRKEKYPGFEDGFVTPPGDDDTVPPPPSGPVCGNGVCDVFVGENGEVIPLEDNNTCPADCLPIPPPPQCQNATDTNGGDSIADTGDDDGDGLVDFPNSGWLNGPDPGCSSPYDNSELDTVVTVQCNDGYDNDSDGQTDFPADTDCSSPTDNSELVYIVQLCANTGNDDATRQPCQNFSSSTNLVESTIGNDNASYLLSSAILFNVGFIVEVCVDSNYINCTVITPAMVDGKRFSPPVNNGWMNLSELGLDNMVSSIRITQP